MIVYMIHSIVYGFCVYFTSTVKLQKAHKSCLCTVFKNIYYALKIMKIWIRIAISKLQYIVYQWFSNFVTPSPSTLQNNINVV